MLFEVSSWRNFGLGSVYEVSEAFQHYIIVLSAFRCIIGMFIIISKGRGRVQNRVDNTDDVR